MRKFTLLILFLMLIPTALYAGDAGRVFIEAVPVGGEVTSIFPEGTAPVKLEPAMSCHGEWQGPLAFAIPDFYEGNEYYAVYQDPTETGCTNTYPFEVQNIIWTVSNNTGSDLTIFVVPIIYTADLEDPFCPKPGVVWYRGPVYHFVLPASITGTVNFPMAGNCVNGPYFAGIYCPEFIGGGLLNLVIDDGVTSPFLVRPCATYCNYLGQWDDLAIEYSFPGNLKLWSDGVNADEATCDTCAVVLEPGVDLWLIPRDGNLAYQAETYFQTFPLPADFFGPGSDPFDGIIAMQGSPLGTYPGGVLGPTDAVIERLDSALLPGIASNDIVDLEIIALSLVSTEPIIITYMGGMDPEMWDVRLCLSEVPFQWGYMELLRECCLGGEFFAEMAFRPRYVFTHPVMGERVYDFGLDGNPHTFSWITEDGVWTTEMHPPYGMNTSPGLVSLDHDCSSSTPDIAIGQSTKFMRCENTITHPCHFPHPCQPQCCVGLTGDVDCSGHPGDAEPDISDITRLIDYLYISHKPLCCAEEADVDVSGGEPDISDITYLIDHLYLSHKALPSCP
ncbi:MAG: hypothetical protein JXA92_09555 [candidate division Zixibacteria bacterium]|nr:hypothetical protein [candidate division Zixibacteria bacterium]